MKFEEIPRTLQRLIIVTVQSAGYAQNEENDTLLGPGYDFVAEVSESILKVLNAKEENCQVVSFGANAFRDAGTVVTAACRKFRKNRDYPLANLDARLDSDKNMYKSLLDGRESTNDGDKFFRHLMEHTSNAGTVILVTGRLVGINLSRYMCKVLKITSPESNRLYDTSVDMRLVTFSFEDKKILYELRPVE